MHNRVELVVCLDINIDNTVGRCTHVLLHQLSTLLERLQGIVDQQIGRTLSCLLLGGQLHALHLQPFLENLNGFTGRGEIVGSQSDVVPGWCRIAETSGSHEFPASRWDSPQVVSMPRTWSR